MKKVEIIPLGKSELGQLTGGFNCAESAKIEVASISNSNCSTDSGWWNDNCGCNACKEAVMKPSTETRP